MSNSSGFHPSQNFIEHAVKKNYTRALNVSTFHFNALTAEAADPDIAAMLALFTPKHNVLVNAISGKGVDLGARIGKTASLKSLFKNLIDVQLPAWQLSIQATYIKSSTQYKGLFPFGNKSFTSGTIDNRINAVKILRDACTLDGHALVNVVGVAVDAFYNSLLTARGEQEGKKALVKTDAGGEKDAIHNMCVVHFANFGSLIAKYPDNPDAINSFLDIVSLQEHHHGSLYAGTVNPLKIKKALTHAFTGNSTIVFSNNSDADYRAWIAEKAKDKIHPDGVIIPAQTVQMIVEAKKLGDTHHRVLMIQDLDPATDTSYEIEVGDKNSTPLTDPHD